MKNKKKKLINIIIVITIFAAILVIGMAGKKNDSAKKSSTGSGYTNKMYITKKNNGWVYYFKIVNVNNAPQTKNFFGGCNLKYQELDEYNILVYDGDQNVIGHMKSLPKLSISQKMNDGITEAEEVKIIDEFFNKNQFNRKIKLQNLSELDLKNFDKMDLVDLYNGAIDLNFESENGILDLSQCSITEEKDAKDYTIQIGLIINADHFKSVWLDIKYDNGMYLSDLIEKNTASAEQKEIYKNFKEIEQYIIKNDNIKNLKEKFKDLNNITYTRLFDLANKLY